MDLAAIPMPPLTPTDDVIRKKPKLDAMRVDSRTVLDRPNTHHGPAVWMNGHRLDAMTLLPTKESSRVIPETPQAAQPRLLPDIASFAQPTTFISSFTTGTVQKHNATSHKSCSSIPSSSKPRPRTKSLSPPPSALTWQDSEITGHLADPSTDPDDDGTGLNGIGFKPTPALAYARSQKRRQQLNEWKARETREARAKRSERRRRRGVRETPSKEATVEREVMPVQQVESKRSVKFAV
jgi:hypothetical protein